MRKLTFIIVLGTLLSGSALAQNQQETERKVIADKLQVELRQAAGFSLEAMLVKGAPYAASAESESTQLLADGNRIHYKTTTQVFRDSAGRTRREVQSRSGGASQVYISDPVSGLSYTLDPLQRLATRRDTNLTTLSTLKATMAAGVNLEAQQQLERQRSLSSEKVASDEAMVMARKLALEKDIEANAAAGNSLPRVAMGVPLTTVTPGFFVMSDKGGKRESLGTQVIEGVKCEGKRTTVTIEANAIGNDLPINIITEEWYSPELQVLVLTKHSDPRMGETVYRLTGVVRGEQPKDLFEPPSDYTIRDLARPVATKRMKEEQ